MALESATYFHQMREDSPTGLDPKSQGDDHIRMIKSTLKTTFPNVRGKVDASHEQLNGLTVEGALVPTGCIMMWPYSGALPAGWADCDGAGGRPDLRGQFVRCQGGAAGAVGVRGGRASHNHTTTVNVANHVLTVAQIPSHSHDLITGRNDSSSTHRSGTLNGHVGNGYTATYNAGQSWIGRTGGGGAHTHAGSTAATAVTDHTPVYTALRFIIKL